MHRFSIVLVAVSLAACGGSSAASEPVVVDPAPAAPQGLIAGGALSNFGEVHLSTGFLPDPHSVSVVSGASADDFVNIEEQALSTTGTGTCTGFATGVPDYIVHVDSPGALLRFFVQAPGDTTLVVNDGAGHWWCSDDDGGNLNPMLDIASPPAGQYDVWVGSYEPGANIQAVLSVTELDSNHP
jgi:hypothetical protein